jgi:hypothetical protein
MAPVSPRQKSTSSWPSRSTTRLPWASAWTSGKPPGALAIHVMGTPAKRCAAPSAAAARDRGFRSA